MKYKHAKVAPYNGVKLSTVLLAMAAIAIGAVGVKAIPGSDSDPFESTTVEVKDSSDNCSKLFSGQSCRIEAAINEALGQ